MVTGLAAKVVKCTPIRDAWVRGAKLLTKFATDGAFIQSRWNGGALGNLLMRPGAFFFDRRLIRDSWVQGENILETVFGNRVSLDEGSRSKKGQVQTYQGFLGSRCKTS